MKKILAVLLLLAMALSMSSVAFAADEIDCYEMQSYQDGRREGVVVTDLKAGDIVGFYIKPVAGEVITEASQTKMYVRHVEGGDTKGKRLDAEGNVTSDTCYGIWFDEEGKNSYLWKSNDGWYYIEAEIQKDGANYFAVVTYDEGDEETKANVVGCKVGECFIAGLTVNGTAVDPAKVFPYDGSKSVTATTPAVKTTIADPRSAATETPAETEDAPVEETGVVSIAVVAVAAVIGGAVVLKKREF